MENVTGRFIAFEGPEGSGKSTQIGYLVGRLEGMGCTPLVTKEPGGTPVGERVRAVLLDPALSMVPLAEFLLYSASRAQHVAEVIRPALGAGRLVISDRFAGASVAYQGDGRGLPHPFIRDLTQRVTGGLKPHLTVLLDIGPERGLKRVAARGARDRLELADLGFHKRVREGFLRQAGEDPSWVRLDASKPEEALAEEIWGLVQPLLKDCSRRA